MLCETKFVSKEDFFNRCLNTMEVGWWTITTRFSNMWFNRQEHGDKIRIAERYSSFRNIHILETAQTNLLCGSLAC